MNIYITLDYELFFGEKSGDIENCIIKPTNKLLEIVDRYNIKLVVFVDVGYLIKLNQYKEEYPDLAEDFEAISSQIKHLSKNGHSVELHIHPHWEDTTYNGKEWVFDLSRYKLSDFSKKDVYDIITEYARFLANISGISPVAYRAGGWSAQPFSHIKKGLLDSNIYIDSTTYPGGFHSSKYQNYDFRSVKQYRTIYNFENNLTIPEEGLFTEYPISSYKLSPLFFWKFAYYKITKSKKHNSYGNGSAIKKPRKETLRLLTQFSNSVVSIDGYKASFIDKAFKKYIKNTRNEGHFVLIGHPKAFTLYSLTKTEDFIKKHFKNHTFSVFN